MQAWENFLTLLEKELGVETVQKWLKPLKVAQYDACNLYLHAKDSFQILWFEEHVRKKALTSFFNNNKKRILIHLTVENGTQLKKTKKLAPKEKPQAIPVNKISFNFDTLDPSCTFDRLIFSPANELTYKLLFKVGGYNPDLQRYIRSQSEIGVFNPIFIYGSTGTGKTHLLMGIGNALAKQQLNVAYTRAETFTEHVVSAIRAGEMSAFRQEYRNVDVLIIDDVQVLSRKWATQEELFHTFNSLHLAGKQIILSANCSPGELQFIEPRIISRFEWGIVLTLEQLAPETIKEALLNKSMAMNFTLNPRVIDFLTETFNNNLKSLNRALEALILRSHLNSQTSRYSSTQLTAANVKHLLSDLIVEEEKNALNPQKVIQHVAEFFGIRNDDILGKAQSRDCVVPRQIAMYFCRMQLKIPFKKIGDLFLKDHSTVMSSVKNIQKGLDESNEDIVQAHHAILKKIKG